MIHKAELIGNILALHLINTEKGRRVHITVGTDNQAALKAYNSDMRKPAHYAAQEVIHLANMLQKKLHSKNYSLMLRWTAGHAGIPDNEMADGEAKRMAEGQHSKKKTLPIILRCKLATNPSAVQQCLKADTKWSWSKKWKNSDRGHALAKIDNSTPSAHLLRLISNTNISCKLASLITQTLTEHILLNAYLKRFKLVNSARCPACGNHSETVRHFLLHCPSYTHKRWALEK